MNYFLHHVNLVTVVASSSKLLTIIRPTQPNAHHYRPNLVHLVMVLVLVLTDNSLVLFPSLAHTFELAVFFVFLFRAERHYQRD